MNPVAVAIKKWKLDTNHTNLGFKICHLGLGSIKGFFGEYDGEVEMEDGEFENCRINLTIDVASINTGNEMRDNHLKTSEFFDAFAYQTIGFESIKAKKTGKNTFELIGKLTMKDISKQITLQAKYQGTTQDLWGNTVAIFQLKGKINRMHFGIEWFKALENGLPVISKEVELDMNIELIHQEEE